MAHPYAQTSLLQTSLYVAFLLLMLEIQMVLATIPTMAGFTGIILMVIYDEKKKKTYGKKL